MSVCVMMIVASEKYAFMLYAKDEIEEGRNTD